MKIEDFRESAYITWDKVTNDIRENLFANSGDIDGRILNVIVKDEGATIDLTGYALNLRWRSATNVGLDGFEPIDATQGVQIGV